MAAAKGRRIIVHALFSVDSQAPMSNNNTYFVDFRFQDWMPTLPKVALDNQMNLMNTSWSMSPRLELEAYYIELDGFEQNNKEIWGNEFNVKQKLGALQRKVQLRACYHRLLPLLPLLPLLTTLVAS